MRTLLVVVALLAPGALAVQPPSAAWVVSSDTTLEDIPFVLAQDIVVMPGATLRLKAVDALAPRPVNITVLGALELLDGTRVAAMTLPYGIWIAPGGSLLVEDATLVGAQVAVAGVDARLRDATLAAGGLRVLSGGRVDVDGAAIDGAIGPAALVESGGTLRLANATVGQTGDYGLRSEGGSVRVENASFTLSPSYAVLANGGSIDIVDSSFTTHCGAYLVSGATGTIARNGFHTLDHGLSLVQAGAMDVEDNAFVGNIAGLLSYSTPADVSGNTFDSNDIGIKVLLGSSQPPVAQGNSFIGNTLAVKNGAAGGLDATLSWWGSAAGPAVGATSGSVSTGPWLTVAP